MKSDGPPSYEPDDRGWYCDGQGHYDDLAGLTTGHGGRRRAYHQGAGDDRSHTKMGPAR